MPLNQLQSFLQLRFLPLLPFNLGFDVFRLPFQIVKRFLLLLELSRVQMLFRRSRLLFNAALQAESLALQIGWKLGLQFFETFPRIDFVRVQASIRRNRDMQKMHVRRFLVHVDFCGNDVFRAHKLRKELFAFLEKTFCMVRR